jgi:hypothetical protein
MKVPHPLEDLLGVSAPEILEAIRKRFRLVAAVRGAVAEEELFKHLEMLRQQNQIDGFETFDEDGYPDCRVDVNGLSYLIECKSAKVNPNGKVTIDFQRTRNPTGEPWLRLYSPDEFSVLAAWWRGDDKTPLLRFAATEQLRKDATYGELHNRIASNVTVEHYGEPPSSIWTSELPSLLSRITGQSAEELAARRSATKERRKSRRKAQAAERAAAKAAKAASNQLD